MSDVQHIELNPETIEKLNDGVKTPIHVESKTDYVVLVPPEPRGLFARLRRCLG